MTRVVYLCQNLDVGGAEELIAAYARRLPSLGIQVGVVCLTRKGRIAVEIERSGTPFWLVQGEPGPRDPGAFLRLVRLLRRLRPGVAHSFLVVAGIYGRLASLAARVPVLVATEANVYRDKPARHVMLERALSPFTYRVIASSKAVQSFASCQMLVPLERMPVLYNAVDFDSLAPTLSMPAARAALGLPADATLAGTVARMTEQKGHRVLLDALRLLADRRPSFHLALVGYGPLEEALKARAAEFGLSDRVHFLGMRRDLGTVFAALDLFVLPSLWEGLPLVVLEAMGAGLPVVATSVGGTPEAVDDGESGILVPPGEPALLADAMERLLDDPSLRARIGEQARSRSRQRFGMDAHVTALASLYRAGLAERGVVSPLLV